MTKLFLGIIVGALIGAGAVWTITIEVYKNFSDIRESAELFKEVVASQRKRENSNSSMQKQLNQINSKLSEISDGIDELNGYEY